MSLIEDYGVIGDCESAALVGRDGAIDWLCLPRFDSAACFAALLGDRDNGRWLIAPAAPARTRRRYCEGTLVLETEHTTDEGTAVVVDFMPLRDEAANLVRLVEGRAGSVTFTMDLRIRFDYGSIIPWVYRADGELLAVGGPDTLRLRTPVETRGEGYATTARFTVKAGQRIPFVLTWHPSQNAAPTPIDPERALAETRDWWRQWAGRSRYCGRWPEAVNRSLLVLKALTYQPTGGIVAAATTSLPEMIGGVRNWDYRFCWLRDATFTLYALMEAGYVDEASAWRQWLLRAAAGVPAQIHLMYGLRGERRLTELELDWLAGYEGSRPVRIGNGAHRQRQLDVFGELMDALYRAARAGLPEAAQSWNLQRAVIEYLGTIWTEPDHGIWEVRGPARQFTHSKVMAWVALDRAIKTVENFAASGPVDHWRALRDDIHRQVCAQGFDQARGTFVQSYGSPELDASLLMIPLVGFLPADDPRVRGTVAAIERELVEDGFVRRYQAAPEVDGLPEGEGAFLLCTFWLADVLALLGRRRDAEALFERVLAVRNDLGLLSESYDVQKRRLVGNFPQAFSHVGLVNTARNLSDAGGPAEDRPAR
jgi:GH15 family glucan-1,4-alpha-glucosidase